VPGFATDPKAGPLLFNARSEEVASKPSFANAVATRRAVIPVSGYYEWRVVDGVSLPYYVFLPGDELLVLAGLFEWWRNPDAAEGTRDRWLLSATILTRASTGNLTEMHDRMPVFLDADLVEGWLDPQEQGTQELVDEVVAGAEAVADRIRFHRLGAAVGSAENNGQELIAATA
jgi:putative SOS response-associated peptidase YedK